MPARSAPQTVGARVREVLVDTSVWVDFFRRSANSPWRTRLVDLLEKEAVVVVDPIFAELLYGAHSERERTVIRLLSESVRRPGLDLDIWRAAGALGNHYRAQGVTLALVDCLIAAVARRDSLELWTLDEDFAPLVTDGVLTRFAPEQP